MYIKSTYNVGILNPFNPELKQLNDTEFAIKNKLQKLLSELRGFKFIKALVLVFKKIESKDKTKFDNFYSSSQVSMKVTLIMCLNQPILQL